jgi:hypothetical protein
MRKAVDEGRLGRRLKIGFVLAKGHGPWSSKIHSPETVFGRDRFTTSQSKAFFTSKINFLYD